MIISAILAVGRDNEIGLNGGLPWNCSGDMLHFKNITKTHTVLMGHNTYKSIGKPLPNRLNIVISAKKLQIDGCVCLCSVEGGIEYAKQKGECELFIIGGASVYKYCAEKKLINRIYISHIVY